MSKKIQAELNKFNDNDTAKAEVKKVNEYLTLFIDGQEITSGSVEVYQRLKQINKENGYNYL